MAISQEFFSKELQAQLRMGAAFLSTVTNDDMYANGASYHIPQSGVEGDLMTDNQVYPLTATRRTDTDLRIDTHYESTGLTVLPRVETGVLAYDKYASVVKQKYEALTERLGNKALQSWVPSTAKRIVQKGAQVTFADVVALRKQMDLDKVPQSDRFLALPTDMYYELIQDEAVLKALNNGFGYSVVEGLDVIKVGGFNIWQRPRVAFATSTGASTDSEVALAYHKGSLSKCQEAIEMFVRENDPAYQGDIVSGGVRFGSGIRRADEAGVVALCRA